jgi:outer membrane immunogenic protein
MNKTLLSAAMLAIVTSQAFAADLPSRKEPVAAPPPPLWTGFHLGVNIGGTWTNGGSAGANTIPVTPVEFVPGATTSLLSGFSSGNSSGLIGGGQVGYDYQIPIGEAGFVAGIEADIQGIAASGGGGSSVSAFRNNLNFFRRDIGVTSINGSSSLDYLGTVRGRLGYLVLPTLLVYGTGGLAYGHASMDYSAFQIYNSAIFRTNTYTAFGNASDSGMQVGYTVGGGLEWMFLPNWSVKAEYLYYDLGSMSADATIIRIPNRAVNTQPAAVQAIAGMNGALRGNIARAGVNYHFNWGAAPVVAAY